MHQASEVSEDAFRELARSSQWAWTTLEFEHTTRDRAPVHAWIRRPFDLRIETAEGQVSVEHAGSVTSSQLTLVGNADDLPNPEEPPSPGAEQNADGSWMEGDPMYENYQWVAMLRPNELADGQVRDADPAGPTPPPGTTIDRVYAADRLGRDTWWAELSPAEGTYDPRCSCCPLLLGRESHLVEMVEGNTRPLDDDLDADSYASSFLVGVDVQTGICVSVDHLDGSQPGEAFSVRIIAVDEPMSDDLFASPSRFGQFRSKTLDALQSVGRPRG